jgi:predicted transcriptional regulator
MVAYGPMKKTQTLVQLTPDLLAALDQQASASGRSRSDIIREAIRHYIGDVLQDEIDRKILAGYRKKPQEADPWAEAATRESIAAEPW